tara:strand:+ start:1260 stop:1439 length:180 start_codon:yes stop_codon:yes gene_type:complete
MMSKTKRWLEELSVEMGFGGEITDEVMFEGRVRMGDLNDEVKQSEEDAAEDAARAGEDS